MTDKKFANGANAGDNAGDNAATSRVRDDRQGAEANASPNRPGGAPGQGAAARLHAPATDRNREPILAVLAAHLPAHGRVLEIASGSGEHACHFARHLPGLTWQPSDPEPAARASIDAWRAEAGLSNLLPSLALDVLARDWPALQADALVCINMIHIAPARATPALFEQAARLLGPGAPLILYGPYRRRDRELEPSNAAFDLDLKRRNPDWGLRELEAVAATAAAAGFDLVTVEPMPANNLSLVFRRIAPAVAPPARY